MAEDTEKQIIAIQGEQSEKLIEIYSLYSYFAIQQKRADDCMVYQRRSTKLCEENHGEMSMAFL